MLQLEERAVARISRNPQVNGLANRIQESLGRLFDSSERAGKVKDFLDGVWLGHPFHPAMTDVTLGALATAVFLDGVESVSGKSMQQATTASIGLGLASSMLTAPSGLADWTDLRGQQRRLGAVHALANSLATILFGASLLLRLRRGGAGAKAFSTAGFLTLLFGAYLGGDLAFRLGVQVNRNAWVEPPKQFIPVMSEADPPLDKPTRAMADGVPVVLVRQGDRIFAMNETCSHAHGPLSEGQLENGTIVCPWHGSTYELEDGMVVHGPSPYSQTHYEVQVVNGQIEVRAQTTSI